MNRMHRFRIGFAMLTVGLLACGSVQAQVSPSIGIASEYIFRGTPDGSPQGWGSIDWTSSSGPYASAWLSSTARTPETDLYGGYLLKLNAVRLDVGGIGYLFPGSPAHARDGRIRGHGNNSEVYGGIGGGVKGLFTASSYAYYNFGSDVRIPGLIGANDQFVYWEGNLSVPLPVGDNVSLGTHVGYTFPTGSGLRNVAGYMDYGMSLNVDNFFVSVTGNLARDAVLGGPNTAVGNVQFLHDKANGSSRPFARPTFTVGWSKTFSGAFGS